PGESAPPASPKLSSVRRVPSEPSGFMMKISAFLAASRKGHAPPGGVTTQPLPNTSFSRGSGGSPHAGEPVNAAAANANTLAPASRRLSLSERRDALRAELVVMVSPSLWSLACHPLRRH